MSTFNQPELHQGMKTTFERVVSEYDSSACHKLFGEVETYIAEETKTSDLKSQKHQIYMMCLIGNTINTRLLDQGSQCVNLQFEFLAPIREGDRISTTIELVNLDRTRHMATCAIECLNQEKNQVIIGNAALLIGQR